MAEIIKPLEYTVCNVIDHCHTPKNIIQGPLVRLQPRKGCVGAINFFSTSFYQSFLKPTSKTSEQPSGCSLVKRKQMKADSEINLPVSNAAGSYISRDNSHFYLRSSNDLSQRTDSFSYTNNSSMTLIQEYD